MIEGCRSEADWTPFQGYCRSISTRCTIYWLSYTDTSYAVSNCLLLLACPYYADDLQKEMKSRLLHPRCAVLWLLVALTSLFAGCRTKELAGVKEYQEI